MTAATGVLSVNAAVGALFLSFHGRKPVEGAGDLVGQNFGSMVRQAVNGPVVDVFHNDAPGCREMAGLRVEVKRRSTASMCWRLLTRAQLGRLRFRFRVSPPAHGPANVDLFMDGVGFAPILQTVSATCFRRIVVLHHNFEPDYYADRYHGKRGVSWWTRAGFLAQRAAMQLASHNLFLTRQDREKALRVFGAGRGITEVFGAFEPVTARPEVSPARSGPLRVLITGTLSDRKGYLGLIEMLRTVLTRKSQYTDRLRFVVAGRDPTPELSALADGDFITLISNPPSIPDIVRTCDVYLNPNHTGSGIKIRNLDGLRHGLPVFCRIENAAGFDQLPGPVFNPFVSVADGLDRLVGLSVLDTRSERMKNLVWDTYARYFSLDTGIARLRALLMDPAEE